MLKNKIIGLGCALASIFFVTSPSLEAFHPVSDVSLTGGWRRDEVKTTFDNFGFGNNELKLKDVNTWEFGLRGQYAFTGFCGCEESWLDDFYVKGSAVWGWGNNGKFTNGNDSSGYGYDYGYGNGFGHIDAKNTRTYDYDIGFGWLYAIDCNWGIGPTVGYAWNRLTTHQKFNSSGYSSDLYGYGYDSYSGDKLEYSTKWYGPWLGLEVDYEDCEWHFDLGYEFHWARNHTKLGDFSGKSNDSRYGNVVYLDAYYDLCDGWEVGVGFKWKSFQSGRHGDNGSGSSSYFASGSDYGYDYEFVDSGSSSGRGGKTRWTSWGFTVDLGYRF